MEFKAAWDAATTGPQVLRTVCAFANDFHNLNGGYVVIGVAERDGRAELPPAGLSDREIEDAQRWLRGNCNRLDPVYQPILSPEEYRSRQILVVWAPASDTKPHRAPADAAGTSRYWIRLGADTVDAEKRGSLLGELIQQTARVPWDDRRARTARMEDLSESRVREHLRDTRSGLLDEPDAGNVYRRMRITARVNDHEVPRNAALLFFSMNPARWFRGATIEVVQFAADRAGDVQEERIFGGALADQLRGCLSYLESFSVSHLQKARDRSHVRGWVSNPLSALRETLVNAVYHRGYDVDQPEPTKVYLHPSRVEVISYPGPVPGIERQHLVEDAIVPQAPARNRRIGEFLKELGLAEGRLSGLPKVFRAMKDNGSPELRFDFDDERTYFQATLPAHPEYGALSALRDAAHLRALGDVEAAFRRMETAWESNPASAVLATEMIRQLANAGETARAEGVLSDSREHGPDSAVAHVANTLADVMIEHGDREVALRLLRQRRPPLSGQDAIDAAILARRARDSLTAHRHFERAGGAVDSDPRALLEFAQTKPQLSQEAYRQRRRNVNRRFLTEARALLERVIQLDTSPARRAWAWRELARTLRWLGAPPGDIERAYRRAIDLLPGETRFKEEMRQALSGRQ